MHFTSAVARGVFLGVLVAVPIAQAAELGRVQPLLARVSANGSKAASVSATLASSAGAVLDADLLKGGGTDDTAALQAVLDLAASGKSVRLVIDGAALVSGLNVYGNTTIDCLAGGGLYLKDQASRDVIRNVHRSRDAITDEHITIRGCFLNGNRTNQLHRPPSGDVKDNQEPDGTWLTGVQLSGVKDVRLEELTLWNVRSFGICITNAEHITVRDIRVDNGSPRYDSSLSMAEQWKLLVDYLNTDGVHLNGPIHDAILEGLTLHTGDDALALNANDEGGPYVGQGPITDVVATNIVLDEAAFGIRMLSTDQRIDRVIIEDIAGTVKNRAVLLSHWLTPAHTGNFGSVLVNNINVRAVPYPPSNEVAAFFKMTEEDLALDNREFTPLIALNASIESLSLQNVMIDASDARPLIDAGPEAAIQSLSIGLSVRDPELLSIPLRLEAGARIDRLSWALDWQGQELDQIKQPILNLGAKVRQLRWIHTPPMYVNAWVNKHDARAVDIQFSQGVRAADFRSGVTVRVNGTPVHILQATRLSAGDVVRYRIAASIRTDDSVTWAYEAASGTIQNADGDHMLSVLSKCVSLSDSGKN